ncbi:MAG: hypothetical protein Q8N18_13215 [Opitutaceae bacterium]|nr:hypothetical protein [Opitutaceae bacterium]
MTRFSVPVGWVVVASVWLGAVPLQAHLIGDAAHDELARMAAEAVAAERAALVRSAARRPGPWRVAQVKVTPENARVDYLRAYPAQAEDDKRKTGAVTHRYTVAPAK